ncbi:MAG: hypothetical protein HYY05_01800 [Chloroflexi bacterium]|nr:hypothetical protein [Chloroflexota bacterium]
MASALVSLISIAVMVTAMLTLIHGGFFSAEILSRSWKTMETRTSEIARTKMEIIATSADSTYVYVTLKNSGQVPWASFTDWDVVVQWYTAPGAYKIQWMGYTAGGEPGSNRWAVSGIYRNAASSLAEVFQPGILDPAEEMKIKVKPSPPLGPSTNNWIVIATPNGVSTSALFTR